MSTIQQESKLMLTIWVNEQLDPGGLMYSCIASCDESLAKDCHESFKQNLTAEQKQLARQDRQTARGDQQASESSVEKKNVYSKSGRPQRTPVIQNYDTKETDDFYRVQNRGSRLSEGPGYYIIEAYAPEHEKDNLRVSIQRGKAIVSGQRKFSDEAKDGNKNMRTSNYQSFREEFKFDRPVSGEGMTRERIGDFVRFSIPKLEAIDDPTDQS